MAQHDRLLGNVGLASPALSQRSFHAKKRAKRQQKERKARQRAAADEAAAAELAARAAVEAEAVAAEHVASASQYLSMAGQIEQIMDAVAADYRGLSDTVSSSSSTAPAATAAGKSGLFGSPSRGGLGGRSYSESGAESAGGGGGESIDRGLDSSGVWSLLGLPATPSRDSELPPAPFCLAGRKNGSPPRVGASASADCL